MMFPIEKMLTADMVKLNEIINPEFMSICGEHFAISCSVTDPMIYLYSTPSLEFENSFVRKGRGPNEIPIFPMFCKSPDNNSMYIWGYTPVTIKKFHINGDNKPEYEREFRLSRYEAFNYMNILNDSLFLYYLPDELTIKKYDLVNNCYLDEIKFKMENHKESFFFSNRGMMDANTEKIVYSYIFKKQIDIFDVKTMKRTAQIKTKGKTSVQPSFDFNDVTKYYWNLYAGKDYFYALYGGSNNSENVKNSALEVFDYDGNPIAKYQFDTVPYLFVVDEAKNIIYGYNHDVAPDHLLKFTM